MSILDAVKRNSLFFELSDEEIETIISESDIIELEDRAPLVKDGETGETLFIILSGVAAVEKNGVELTKLRQGDIIGEFILLNELTRTADIFAHQELTVLSLKNSTVFELYRTNPKIFAILMLNLSRRLMEKLKYFTGKTKELSHRIDELEAKEAA